jgi:hypothetical protein
LISLSLFLSLFFSDYEYFFFLVFRQIVDVLSGKAKDEMLMWWLTLIEVRERDRERQRRRDREGGKESRYGEKERERYFICHCWFNLSFLGRGR